MAEAVVGSGAMGENGSGVRVTGLFRYPIKSCRGQAIDAAAFDARGVVHDREFAVVAADGDDAGRILTQRQIPRMALVAPELTDDGLRLAAPDMPALAFRRQREGRRLQVEIWRDSAGGVDQGDAVADWLGAYLGQPVRLARMAEDHVRPVDPAYARPTDQTGFTDGYPLLLCSEESLAELNRRLAATGEAELPMSRFRPNIVVAGAPEPHAEDGWGEVHVGDMTLNGVKLCARCAIATTDQDTAETGKEPLRTFAGYRKFRRGVMFGQNMTFDGPGTIRVGDAVDIRSRVDLSLA